MHAIIISALKKTKKNSTIFVTNLIFWCWCSPIHTTTWLHFTGQIKSFFFVQKQNRIKPLTEFWIRFDVVSIGSTLKQFYLGQHFEFFPPFVKIDETFR